MKILICGAGAIGSNLTRFLAADLRGKHSITVLDKDKIEERNVTPGTQFYLPDQIGISKVEALQYNIYKQYQREIDIKKGELGKDIPSSALYGYDLIIDCFDNYKARDIVKTHRMMSSSIRKILHIGFSDQFTFAIEWDENYTVPTDIESGFDICEMPGASAFVGHVASLGTLITEEYVNSKEQIEIIGNKFNYQLVK